MELTHVQDWPVLHGALGNGASQIWSQWPICKIVAISVKGGGSHRSALAICLALWLSTRALRGRQISNNCALHMGRQPLQKGFCGEQHGARVLCSAGPPS